MAHEGNLVSAVIVGLIVGGLLSAINIIVQILNIKPGTFWSFDYGQYNSGLIGNMLIYGFIAGFAAQYIVRYTGVS